MLKRRGFSLIAISLVLAFGAAWLAHNWMQARLRTDANPKDIQVVVAALEIPFGSRVEARQLRVITIPRNTLLGNNFDNPDAVVGLIAVQKILPGEILLHEQFTQRPNGSTLAALLKPEQRAITVRVDDVVGVAGFLLPGNHVDVVATRMVNQRAETKTILRDLVVLAVDQTAAQDKTTPVVVRAVTLEVSPHQAEQLVEAREQGSIQLTLRSPTATDRTDTSAQVALHSNEVPSRGTLPRSALRTERPAKLAPERARLLKKPQEGTTIIRGTKVQHTPTSD